MTNLSLALKRTILRIITKIYSGRIVTTRDGLKIRVGEDWIVGRVVLHRNYEAPWTSFVAHFLKPGDRTVDVGANFGYYSLIMQNSVGAYGDVHAFEPNPIILDDLKENLKINGFMDQVSLHEMGLGEIETSAEMCNDSKTSGLGFTRSSSEGSIKIARLDNVMGDFAGEIAFIKMDIEGNEISALTGSSKILSHTDSPVMIIEFNREALERQGVGYSSAFWDLMILDYGYSVYGLDENSRPRAIGIPNAEAPDGNFLFIPASGVYRSRLRAWL